MGRNVPIRDVRRASQVLVQRRFVVRIAD